MLTLPLPVVVALTLAFVAARAWLGSERGGRWHPLLILMVGAMAAQSLLIALVQHYGITGLRWLQPITASALPPLTWCAFVAVQVRQLRARDAWHGLAPVLSLLCLLFWPDGLDLAVIGSFVLYGFALLLALRTGAAELPLSRLASDDMPRWLWRFVALSLLVSALGDTLISLNEVMRLGESRSLLISAMSSLMLLSLGCIGLSSEWRTAETGDDPANPAQLSDKVALEPDGPEPKYAAPESVDPAMLDRLDTYMREARPWLNPDLTLLTLGRKLGIPTKTLSAAVNAGRGENVARYVNRHRIEHACELLRAGQAVTSALYESGFNSKSNFHREFQRIHGQTPSEWLEQEAQAREAAGLAAKQ
jgi:AraC-like DNA-binding protein